MSQSQGGAVVETQEEGAEAAAAAARGARVGAGAVGVSLPVSVHPGLPQSPWPSFMDHLETREYVSTT
jgi:hypothetical protein